MPPAQSSRLHAQLQERLSVASPNADVKAANVIAGVLAGAVCAEYFNESAIQLKGRR